MMFVDYIDDGRRDPGEMEVSTRGKRKESL